MNKVSNDEGIKTGFDDIDDLTGGLFPGELTVLASRVSVGKSALAGQIAFQAAQRGKSTVWISLDMPREQMAWRLLSAATGVPIQSMRTASVDDEQMGLIRDAAKARDAMPLSIYNPVRETASDIAAKVKMLDIEFMVIDAIDLIHPGQTTAIIYDRTSHVVKELKSLAIELNIPILAVAQLRGCGVGELPTPSHLPASIFNDADMVWLLHRYSLSSSDASLQVAKSRNGQAGWSVPLQFIGEQAMFRSVQAVPAN